jgi:SAM-dependent methyltransferase
MQERHSNRKQYFEEQAFTTLKHVIPFIQKFKPVTSGTEVLEIGCGEGGNIVPFLEIGCRVTGIDLSDSKIENARLFFESHPLKHNLSLWVKDIYLVDDPQRYDIIVMRDVIEHIPNQEKFMGFVKHFLKPDGVIFFGFPPWYMPFGGHQQVCDSKLSKLPWIHLFPMSVYLGLLKMFGEKPSRIESLREVKETGISIERFRRIVRKEGYKTLRETLFLFNPNYEIKFKITPRKQFVFLAAIPFLRNFFTTCMYALITSSASDVQEK